MTVTGTTWPTLTPPYQTETVSPVTVSGTTWPTVTPPPYQFYHHLTRHPEGKLNDCPWNNLTNPNTTKSVRETVSPVTVPGTT